MLELQKFCNLNEPLVEIKLIKSATWVQRENEWNLSSNDTTKMQHVTGHIQQQQQYPFLVPTRMCFVSEHHDI